MSTGARPRVAALVVLTVLATALASPGARADEPHTGTFTSLHWDARAAHPYRTSEALGVEVDGLLYTFGGYDPAASGAPAPPCCVPTDRAQVYDPARDRWTALTPWPKPPGSTRVNGGATHAGIATDGDDVFLAGGYVRNAGTGETRGTTEVWRYRPGDEDTEEGPWRALPGLPERRANGQLEVLDGHLHWFGGSEPDGGPLTGDHWSLDLADPREGWRDRAPMPNPRSHFGSAVVGGKVYAVGGQHGAEDTTEVQDDVDVYDPAADAWSPAAPLPGGRGHIEGSTFAMGGRVVVAGGETGFRRMTREVLALRPGASAWTRVTDLPVALRAGVADAVSGRVLFTTGMENAPTTTGYRAGTWWGVPEPAGGCSRLSELPCDDVLAATPLTLAFGGAAGGLDDRVGRGTGFTMVRGAGSADALRAAYRPELVDLRSGRLRLLPADGTSRLVNALGMGIALPRPLAAQATLGVPSGGARAGVWIGPGTGDHLELTLATGDDGPVARLELGGDLLGDVALPAAAGRAVRLALAVDPATRRAWATARVADAPPVPVGERTVPAAILDGGDAVEGADVFAGVVARAGHAAFDAFGVGDPEPEPQPEPEPPAPQPPAPRPPAPQPPAPQPPAPQPPAPQPPAPRPPGAGTDDEGPATPVDTRVALRLDLGGRGATVGGVRWAACASARACGGARLTGGRAVVARPAPRVRGVRAPATAGLHASTWATRPRERGFTLDVPLADGAWLVRVHASATGPGGLGAARLDLDVAGGHTELVGFDPVAEAGGRGRAVVRDLPVTVRGGALRLTVRARAGRAALAAVELVPVPAARAAVASRLTLAARTGRLTGRSTPAAAGRRVVLERRSAGRWRPAATVAVRRDGTFAARARAGTYRATFAGDGAARAARSPAVVLR